MSNNVLISACLTGIICRYHGKRVSPVRKLMKELILAGMKIIPICPEMLAGMSVPRPPSRWNSGQLYQNGKNVTALFLDGAEKTLYIARKNGIKKAFLTAYSPSCGQWGITTKLLKKNGIEVIPIWR